MSSHLIRPGYETARSYFPPKTEFYIRAYVEGQDDVRFWREVFKRYSPVEVKPSINKGSADGKQSLMKNLSNTGKDIIICVDSDFDYLIPNTSVNSNPINNNKCVFQTYAYSIENFLCYANSLGELCKNITLNYSPSIEFDFVKFFCKFSQKIYKPFIYYLYLRSNNDKNKLRSKDLYKIIKIDSDQLNKAKNVTQLNKLLDNMFNEMESKLMEKVMNLDIEESADDFLKLLEQKKDVKCDEIYLFIKGHILFKDITMRLIRKVCYIYSKEQMKKIIEDNKDNSKKCENKLRQYQKSLCPSGFELKNLVEIGHYHEHSSLAKRLYSRIEDELKQNYEFFECYLMSKIKKDINIFINTYYPNLLTEDK